jgi:rhamnosyltransferase
MLLTNKKILVLLAAYNGTAWIEEQLTSIQAQIGVTVHILISVDASTDGTEAWCYDYARNHLNVTLLPPSEPCGGAARNFFHLLRDADFNGFDLIALSDQDDRWYRDKLARAAAYLAENSAKAYSSNVVAFWPNGKIRLINKSQPQVRWDGYFEAAGPGCTYVLDKSFAAHLQNIIKQHWIELQKVTLHDWFIYAVARGHGYGWHVDAKPSMDYRQHEKNQVGANVGLRALLLRYQTIRNGWWFGQVKLIERLVNQNCPNATRPQWRALNRIDLLALGLHASQCRRRVRDQWLFRVSCLISAVIGAKVK